MRPGRFGRYAIRTADGVQEAAYLPIGGIEQYIRVRGRSRANPVLLVLHGGPGSTLGATACRWQGALEAAFTVVHWDQREHLLPGPGRPAAHCGAAALRPGRAGGRPAGPVWPGQAVPAGPLLGKPAGRALCAPPPGEALSLAPRQPDGGLQAVRAGIGGGGHPKGPRGGAGGGRGKAGAGAGAGAGPAAAGPGGGRSPAAVSPAEGAVSAAPVRRWGDWPPRS